MKALVGKVAVITGAASGIGEALARLCAKEGMRLALCDIHQDKLQAVADSLRGHGAQVLTAVVDVADPLAVETFAFDVAKAYGGCDLMINNAGVALTDTVLHGALDDMHWLMNINFWGVVHGCRSFLPYLQRADEAALVNVSSIFAMLSVPTQSIYNASKAAVRAFSDALREELVDTAVTLTCIHPGGIKTDIARHARVGDCSLVAHDRGDMVADFDRLARTSPQAAAAAILNAVKRKQTRVLIGPDAALIDGLYRLCPGSVASLGTRFTQFRLKRRGAAKPVNAV